MKTRFNSFEEIDQQLRILQLRRSIRREYLVFHTKKMKNAIIPKNWIKTFDGVIYGKAFSWMLKKFLRNRKKAEGLRLVKNQ